MESTVYVRVVDENDKRLENGSGFVIHHDENSTYVVTCLHVVLRPGNIKVHEVPADLYRPRIEDLENEIVKRRDLVVLKTKVRLSVPALTMREDWKPGNEFRCEGWFFDPDGDDYEPSYQPVLGKMGIERQRSLDASASVRLRQIPLLLAESMEPWQIMHGYSGSPIIDPESGSVLGIVQEQRQKVKAGLAAEAKELREVWPDAPASVWATGDLFPTPSETAHLVPVAHNLAESVADGLERLDDLIVYDHCLRHTAQQFEGEFARSKAKLYELKAYKDVHAALHNIQNTVLPIYRHLDRNYGPFVRSSIEGASVITLESISRISDASTVSTPDQDAFRKIMESLETVRDLTESGVRADSIELLQDAKARIGEITEIWPPKIEKWLHLAVYRLPVDEFAKAMRSIAVALGENYIQAGSKMESAAAKLEELYEELQRRSDEHHQWQEIQISINRIFSSGSIPGELAIQWPALKIQIPALVRQGEKNDGIPDKTLLRLQEDFSALSGYLAIDASDPVLERIYRNFDTSCCRRFFYVDELLRAICDQCSTITVPLAALLEKLKE